MRKALVVGIDHYGYQRPLYGCVDDAESVAKVLRKNGDGSPNFEIKLLTSTAMRLIKKERLRVAIEELFAGDPETALLYFSGHGYLESAGGSILASDTEEAEDGLALAKVLETAHRSRARNKVIVLDSCFSGSAASRPDNPNRAEITEGLTILTASTADQYTKENGGRGVFTELFVDALNGAAANLVGEITPGSVYAHIDQSLGSWSLQRPVFKTNVQYFVSLRKGDPPITPRELRKIVQLFPKAGHVLALDPEYEPTSDVPDPKKTNKFAILQRMNRVNLVVPIGAKHMYYAAMNCKSCRLTALGEHYRRLVAAGRI